VTSWLITEPVRSRCLEEHRDGDALAADEELAGRVVGFVEGEAGGDGFGGGDSFRFWRRIGLR
jgi:hypothetical protein